MSPDQIQAIAAVITLLAGGLAIWWRVTAKLHAFLGAQNATLTAVETLRRQVAWSAKRTSDRLDLFAQDIERLKSKIETHTVLLTEREKDLSRLEGQIEQLSSLVVKNVAALQGATSSLDALWRSLRMIHPDKIPLRASDRG